MPTHDLVRVDPATRYPSAVRAMQNAAYIKTPKYWQKQQLANRVGADPRILEFSDKLVKRLKALNIPVFPHCIVRTYDDQQSAYVRGVSWDSPADGLWPHRCGAVDIVHCQLGWMDKIPYAWDLIGHIGKEVSISTGIKVVWGGDFSPRKWDPAHWELEDWREITRALLKPK